MPSTSPYAVSEESVLKSLWQSQKQQVPNWDLYAQDYSVLMLPTCAGAQGLADVRKFHAKYLAAAEKNRYIQTQKVIATHYGHNAGGIASIVEEAIVEIAIAHGHEDQMQWIVPGVKLADPGATLTASIVFVTVVTVAVDQKQFLSKRVYWVLQIFFFFTFFLQYAHTYLCTNTKDQASVLKQLGLVQPAFIPSHHALHHDFVLPVVATPHVKLLSGERDLPFNMFAHRLEEKKPANLSKQSSSESIGSILSGTSTPAAVPRPSVRLLGVGGTPGTGSKQTSHVFDEVELPKSAFSGMAINPKKFETHNSIFGAPTTQQHTASSASAAARTGTMYDPLTGDIPVPRIHDPERHTDHFRFADDGDDNGSTGEPATTPRKVNLKHMETSGDWADDTSSVDGGVTVRPLASAEVPKHLRSHFTAGQLGPPANSQSEEELYVREHGADVGHVPQHMATTLDKDAPTRVRAHNREAISTIGTPGAERDWVPGKNKKVNPSMQATDIAEEEERVRAASPHRAPRSSMDTTLDKDPVMPKRSAKPDQRSHVFGGAAADDSDDDASSVRSSTLSGARKAPCIATARTAAAKMVSNVPMGGDAPAVVPARTRVFRPHTQSNVFAGTDGRVETASAVPALAPSGRKGYAEHRPTKSQVAFGDDGGDVGMPASAPKWVTTQSVPQDGDKRPTKSASSRQPSGGRSTIWLG
ncbi:hypothetical protein BC828DRAFT_377703 [Blastocladiella britannica]|nr:hypothetical protein BC828DRAFT_377703 [Blastocladiella britannica]